MSLGCASAIRCGARGAGPLDYGLCTHFIGHFVGTVETSRTFHWAYRKRVNFVRVLNAFHCFYQFLVVCFFLLRRFLTVGLQKKTWNLVPRIEPIIASFGRNNIRLPAASASCTIPQFQQTSIYICVCICVCICVSSLDVSCGKSKCAYPTDTSHHHQQQQKQQQLHLTKV